MEAVEDSQVKTCIYLCSLTKPQGNISEKSFFKGGNTLKDTLLKGHTLPYS